MSSQHQANSQSQSQNGGVTILKVMPGYSGGQGGGDTRN